MPAYARDPIVATLDGAVPELQRQFIIDGPLRNVLPADIRADIVRVFTQVLCRAIKDGDGEELGDFVDSVVWESRKLGVSPDLYLRWIDRYGKQVQEMLRDSEWKVVEPMIDMARGRIVRLAS